MGTEQDTSKTAEEGRVEVSRERASQLLKIVIVSQYGRPRDTPLDVFGMNVMALCDSGNGGLSEEDRRYLRRAKKIVEYFGGGVSKYRYCVFHEEHREEIVDATLNPDFKIPTRASA